MPDRKDPVVPVVPEGNGGDRAHGSAPVTVEP